MKKVVYLAAGDAVIEVPGCNIVYNDLYLNRDLKCDMLDVNLLIKIKEEVFDYEFNINRSRCLFGLFIGKYNAWSYSMLFKAKND